MIAKRKGVAAAGSERSVEQRRELSYEIVAMEWFHLRDGKVAARWGARDSATIMRQIGQ